MLRCDGRRHPLRDELSSATQCDRGSATRRARRDEPEGPRVRSLDDPTGKWPKMYVWNGETAYQYARPNRPRGRNRARCTNNVPFPVGSARSTTRARRRREAHLGAQSQQSRRLDRLDSPEVDDIIDPQVGRMTTSASHADTADRAIQPASHYPQPVADEPTPVAAQRAHLAEERVGCRVGVDDLTVGEHRGARPLGIGGHRIRGRSPYISASVQRVDTSTSPIRRSASRSPHGTRSAPAAQRR